MNSVDTGWVTDEDPAHIAEQKIVEHRFRPPLDIVDGAARIVDPIIDGFNTGTHVWGAVPEGLPADRLVARERLHQRVRARRQQGEVRTGEDERDACATVAIDELGSGGEDARAHPRGLRAREHLVDQPAEVFLGRPAERVGEVVRPDEDHAEVLDCEDRSEVLDRLGRLDLHRDERVRSSASCMPATRSSPYSDARPGPAPRTPFGGYQDAATAAAACSAVCTRGMITPAAPASSAYWIDVALSSLRRTSAGTPPRSAPAMIVCTSAGLEREVLRVRDEQVEAGSGEHLAGRELRVGDEGADQRLPASRDAR